MRELTFAEVEQVAGSGLIGDGLALVGNGIIFGVKLFNDFLNTPLISSVGTVFDAVGIGIIHVAADLIGFTIMKAIASVGIILGGDDSWVNYHWNAQWWK
ncbi:hypothetical protein ACFSFZ_04685 [Mixta tenebrionis]|uniref:Uncharacterized protein n=1 Tax=Mixta tenebrionis TaxID=2562439 RepID=A0A506V774_9GAMM|nr:MULTISPECIES: hypothetical protein [Mixta]QHM76437.1 hypothetical protein C7M52_02413 [Mixta theicola]TPW41396.1 hypothetical protein FKM52_14190 [Mixta tenebrionis]